MRDISIAFWTYLLPMTSTRAFRIGLVVFLLFIAVIGVGFMIGFFASNASEAMLSGLRMFLVVPGLPVAAILFSEMALRDGIRQRTLLYPLLGPVPRTTMAVVRTLVTASLLVVGLWLLLLVVFALQRGEGDFPTREMMAVLFGSFTYVGLFGLVHLVSQRGLIAGLALYIIIDEPLSKLPFSLRNLSPAYHVRVIADQHVEISLPVRVNTPDTSVTVSCILLVVLAAVFIGATALLFRRRNLGELC